MFPQESIAEPLLSKVTRWSLDPFAIGATAQNAFGKTSETKIG